MPVSIIMKQRLQPAARRRLKDAIFHYAKCLEALQNLETDIKGHPQLEPDDIEEITAEMACDPDDAYKITPTQLDAWLNEFVEKYETRMPRDPR